MQEHVTTHPSKDAAVQRVATFEIERQERLAKARQDALPRARATARTLAAHLRKAYGARRVLLFGSLATGLPSDHPDVDLAVEGLEPGRLTEALGELLCLSEWPVDLVDLDRAPAHLRARIEAEGVLLP